MSGNDTIALDAITKKFAGQTAVDSVSVAFARGAVHALAGMNGSGKSTLVKVLAGAHTPESGMLRVGGAVYKSISPRQAHDLGFRFIHQDPGLFSNQTVADNIAAGSRFRHSSVLRVSDTRERRAAAVALAKLGVAHINPEAIMRDLSPTERTMVAIARAVQDLWGGIDLRLLVLDEPTASLPEHEARQVQDMVTAIAAMGVAIVYITHDLATMIELADVVTVLRDGRKVATRTTEHLAEHELATLMAGSEQQLTTTMRGPRSTEVLLECRALSGGRVSGIDLRLHRGEILGLAGLLGSGRSTTLRMIAGAQQPASGATIMDGEAVPSGQPHAAVNRGIALVPEDRRQHAAFSSMSMADNIMMASLKDVSSPVRIRQTGERYAAKQTMAEFDVRPGDPGKPFGLFSGGNQQKAIIGRWARIRPRVLLLDEPTQGVDVHARAQIHAAIRRLSDAGMSVIVVSSDFGELAELSDRILVFRHGRIKTEISGGTVDEQTILHLAGTA